MKEVILNLPTFAFVVITRAALAGGIGLLLSDKLSNTQRRKIGAALVAVGAITTVPAVLSIARHVGRAGRSSRDDLKPGVRRDEQLAGATRFPRGADDEFVSA
jgi:hypothetical protein